METVIDTLETMCATDLDKQSNTNGDLNLLFIRIFIIITLWTSTQMQQT